MLTCFYIWFIRSFIGQSKGRYRIGLGWIGGKDGGLFRMVGGGYGWYTFFSWLTRTTSPPPRFLTNQPTNPKSKTTNENQRAHERRNKNPGGERKGEITLYHHDYQIPNNTRINERTHKPNYEIMIIAVVCFFFFVKPCMHSLLWHGRSDGRFRTRLFR